MLTKAHKGVRRNSRYFPFRPINREPVRSEHSSLSVRPPPGIHRLRRMARMRRPRFFAGLAIFAAVVTAALVLPLTHNAGSVVRKSSGPSIADRVTATPKCCLHASAFPSVSTSASARVASALPSKNVVSRSATPESEPSSVAMPSGGIPDWHLVYSQNSNGNSWPKDWDAYSEEPGNGPYGWWDRKKRHGK